MLKKKTQKEENLFKVVPVPKEEKRDWIVRIDGKEEKANIVEIKSCFGAMIYEFRPEGYDGVVFYEEGGGGVVTIPYSFTSEGELLVALIQEKRSNMGGKVWCVIGGFVEANESRDQAQRRELNEETGFAIMATEELSSFPTNANRAFFIANAFNGEGVRAYGFEIPFSLLEKSDENSRKLKSSVLLSGVQESDNLRFFPWREAVFKTPDGLARSAISQLFAMVL